jgi:hypothetical protein
MSTRRVDRWWLDDLSFKNNFPLSSCSAAILYCYTETYEYQAKLMRNSFILMENQLS